MAVEEDRDGRLPRVPTLSLDVFEERVGNHRALFLLALAVANYALAPKLVFQNSDFRRHFFFLFLFLYVIIIIIVILQGDEVVLPVVSIPAARRPAPPQPVSLLVVEIHDSREEERTGARDHAKVVGIVKSQEQRVLVEGKLLQNEAEKLAVFRRGEDRIGDPRHYRDSAVGCFGHESVDLQRRRCEGVSSGSYIFLVFIKARSLAHLRLHVEYGQEEGREIAPWANVKVDVQPPINVEDHVTGEISALDVVLVVVVELEEIREVLRDEGTIVNIGVEHVRDLGIRGLPQFTLVLPVRGELSLGNVRLVDNQRESGVKGDVRRILDVCVNRVNVRCE